MNERNRNLENRDAEDELLESYFRDARDETPDLPASLRSAILADAREHAPGRLKLDRPAEAGRRWWAPLRDAFEGLGGIGGAGALTACALAGFWIGAVSETVTDGTALWSMSADLEYEQPITEFFDIAAEG